MYSAEQRKKAIETFARFDCSAADTIAELGYPTRHTLRNWWKEYQTSGDEFLEKKHRKPKYSDEEKRGAVDYYLEHGRSLARTIRAMGYPSREMLGRWIDELAPGQRRRRGPNPEKGVLPIETKVQAVAELEARGGSAAEVADRYGVLLASIHFSPFRPTYFHQSRHRCFTDRATADAPLPASPCPPSRRRRRATRLSGGRTARLSL